MIKSNADFRPRMLWILQNYESQNNCNGKESLQTTQSNPPGQSRIYSYSRLFRILSSKILSVSRRLHNIFWKAVPESDYPHK